MFVDTFTVQYIRKLRKNGKDDEEEQEASRVTPIISILAGVILLICSGILIMAKSGTIKSPKLKIPNVSVKMPDVKLPKVKMPHVTFYAQRFSGPPKNAVIAGEYSIVKQYDVKGVSCAHGNMIKLWQDAAMDGSTVFGSVHGNQNVVGSMSLLEMWQKGSTYFSVVRYNGNERGIVEIDEATQVVRRINPGDGCLFEMRCVDMGGVWKLRQDSESCGGKKMLKFEQTSCRVNGKDEVVGNVFGNGGVVSNGGVLEYHTQDNCVYTKLNVAMESSNVN